MLNSIRNFSKTIPAKIFLFIVAVPFVFWGMGDVFTSGNTNSLAKINDKNISTEDFINHINKLNINQNEIKDRIDENILEEFLGRLISSKLVELEIEKANLVISDKMLAEKIKSNINFLDDNKKFSRTKYEKFLISNNFTANEFEKNFKESEFQDELFKYLGGGIKSPNFLIDNIYIEETKKINVKFINMEKIYLKKEELTTKDIQNYINENQEKLKKDYVDFTYSKVTPQGLIGINEYNNEFFNKIDEMESKLLNNVNFSDIVDSYNLKSISKYNYILKSDSSEIEKRIYKKRNNEKYGLIDQGDYFVIYKIQNINARVPNLSDEEFEKEVKSFLFNKKKFDFNKNILKQINEGKFSEQNFNEIAKEKVKIEKLLLNSKNDTKKFSSESVDLIYSLPEKSFALVADKEKNIYLLKILNQKINKDFKDNELKNIYMLEANYKIKNKIYQSYDTYLNLKYDIVINEKTLERVKNYFR